MKSSLRERLGPRVQVKAIDHVQSGSPVRLSFARSVENPNTPEAAIALASRRMPMPQAHRLMTSLLQLEPGVTLVAEVPMVENVDQLTSELLSFGIASAVFDVSDTIDVKAVREQTGLSQAKFALNYALDEDTVRNWEQGRTKPDHTARAYLTMIASDPEAVRNLLARAIWQPKRSTGLERQEQVVPSPHR
jgi:DNA-binding transcriptional regulator YiaG